MTSGTFGALARCIRNTETEDDPPLIAAVMEELGKVDGEDATDVGTHACSFERVVTVR